MERFTGKIMQGGQVVIDQVEGEMYVYQGGALRSWEGNFEVLSGQEANLLPLIPGQFRLILDDGRSADIAVHSALPHSPEFDFIGAGGYPE